MEMLQVIGEKILTFLNAIISFGNMEKFHLSRRFVLVLPHVLEQEILQGLP